VGTGNPDRKGRPSRHNHLRSSGLRSPGPRPRQRRQAEVRPDKVQPGLLRPHARPGHRSPAPRESTCRSCFSRGSASRAKATTAAIPGGGIRSIPGTMSMDWTAAAARGSTRFPTRPSPPARKGYVRKVIDTVNDLDNVLYEISNEDTGSPADSAWQYHMIAFVKATRPRSRSSIPSA
jgi:hypothetical protein